MVRAPRRTIVYRHGKHGAKYSKGPKLTKNQTDPAMPSSKYGRVMCPTCNQPVALLSDKKTLRNHRDDVSGEFCKSGGKYISGRTPRAKKPTPKPSPSQSKVSAATGDFVIYLSGKTYKYAQSRIRWEPIARQKIGGFGGERYKFALSKADLRQLSDILAEIACNVADRYGTDESEFIYKDMDRFPAESGIR